MSDGSFSYTGIYDNDSKQRKFNLPARKITRQNLVYRLIDREMHGIRKPRDKQRLVRLFYLNVLPNFTVVNVEKPPCFFRKFSPNGLRFIAFSSDQTSLEIYRYQGCDVAASLLRGCQGEYIGNEEDEKGNYIRSHIFNKLFKLEHVVNIAQNKQLNRECSLFTEDGKYVIVGASAYISDDTRPHFYEVYTNNEAVTPNPLFPLEDVSIHLVNMENGTLCDSLFFKFDKIYLSHNQGLYLYKDRLAILSVQHQTIHIYLIQNGQFINVRSIGRFCYEDDSMRVSSIYSTSRDSSPFRPFKEQTINSLKHRILSFIFRDVRNKDISAVRSFYKNFEQFKDLKLWKMQMLDENHLLLKYASEDVVVMKAVEPNAQPSLFVIYDIQDAKVIGVYPNTSPEMLYLLETFTDYFRNTQLNAHAQFLCSPSNNIYAKQSLEKFKNTIISARYGGRVEATRRLLAQVPISAQSYNCSPYLDLALFSFDEKWISPIERPKACAEYPVRFYDRQSGLFKFRLYAGSLGTNVSSNEKRLVAYIFHPTDPFAISVQRTDSDYLVNFHLRHSYAS